MPLTKLRKAEMYKACVKIINNAVEAVDKITGALWSDPDFVSVWMSPSDYAFLGQEIDKWADRMTDEFIMAGDECDDNL